MNADLGPVLPGTGRGSGLVGVDWGPGSVGADRGPGLASANWGPGAGAGGCKYSYFSRIF